MLNEKAALIVGASRGIGEAIVRLFAVCGARVMLAGRDVAAMETIAAEIDPAGERARVVRADMTDAASLQAAVAATVSAFGSLDIAVNNGGVQIPRTALTDLNDDAFDHVISVNLRGVYLAMKHEIRAMLPLGGSIVNITSSAGLVGIPLIAAYVASKHGVVGLTKAAALEYASKGIRINAVAPGTTMTELFKIGPASSPETLAAITSRVPMGRVAEPPEIASAVAWLCSDAAAYLTGVALPVDGGFTV